MAAPALQNGANQGGLASKGLATLGAKTWGDALRFIRVERGFSYKDVANSVCRDRPNDPRNWEMGVKVPDKYDLRRLYNALPKLRHAVHLLPSHLREDIPPPTADAPQAAPSVSPSPEGPPGSPAEVATAMPASAPAPTTVAPEPTMVISTVPDPLPPQWKTFGEALEALIRREKMTQSDFATTSGLGQSTISAYVRGYRILNDKKHPVGMSHLVYERLLALLPDLKYAPRPRVSSKAFQQIPGRQTEGNKIPAKPLVPAAPKGAVARPPEDDVAVRERRPLPPMPETLRKPAPVVAPATMVDKAKAIGEAAAAWGVAIVNVERLRAELASAEAEVVTTYERVQRLVKPGPGSGS